MSRVRHLISLVFSGIIVTACHSFAMAAVPETSKQLIKLVPKSTDQCTVETLRELTAASQDLEQWAADGAWQLPADPKETLRAVEQLLDVQRDIDDRLNEYLKLRTEFVREKMLDRERVRCFLRIAGHLVDLSGRLRYTLRDALNNAADSLDSHPDEFEQLIDLLIQRKNSTGASVLSFVLFDPSADSGAVAFSDELKSKVLHLILAAHSEDLIGTLADFLQDEKTSPAMILSAAVVLKEIGLPQDPPSNKTDEDEPPPITASQLKVILEQIQPNQLSKTQRLVRNDLIKWLTEREKHGIIEPALRMGHLEIWPGDWLLLRNPSPYNRFTDLSPGLFTHIAIVAEETDDEGYRRIVAVDLPERGASIPSTNVETFLQRSLHYMILRHPDPRAAQALATAAASSIGNESQFDLQFRTDRLKFSAGQTLQGQRIYTYCAGFLLACAQTTGLPREDFFPFEEVAATEKCRANLQKLGLSFGVGFVSPTGALFSSHLQLVGQRAPMYDPGREIKEAVFDHFALGMAERELNSSPDLFQSLRLRVAHLSRTNPWLARALAQANGVSPDMDLESAAKAAAVVETLDEIADDSWHQFERARQAILAGTDEDLQGAAYPDEQRRQFVELRKRHAPLLERWLADEITPRQLRIELVEYYSADGRRRIDEQFFAVP